MRRMLVGWVAMVALAVPAAQAAELEPLGLTCAPQDGVRFCPGNGTTDRTPSFDGVPLDADVTLPASGDGPWPTIVMLNGLGGHKRQFEPTAPQPGNGRAPKILIDPEFHNNVWFASRGYAVVAYSSRGFGGSCSAGGAPAAQAQTPPCDRGFVRLADQRYEARDTMHLLGLLADEGVSIPDKFGATGFSYGGGQAAMLGYLNNKIRCGAVVPDGDPCAGKPDGAYLPWRSPKGTPLSFGAVYGQWLWSDLLASLLPNGRYLDFDPSTVGSSLDPLGVEIQSYAQGLYGLAQLDGYVVTPQPAGSPDAPWDLTTAVAKFGAGEPYDADAVAFARGFKEFHGSIGIPGPHAPMLLESAWNDDVFPPAESLRAYADLRARDPDAEVSLLLGDYGHGRAANKPVAAKAFNKAASDFFDAYLRGVGAPPAPGSVTAYLSTCPSGATGPADAGPYAAGSWTALHPQSATIAGAAPQTIDSGGGNRMTGYEFDPIPNTNPLGTADPCKTVAAEQPSGTATYELALTQPLTLLGLPTIRAQIVSTGSGGQIAGRLWDVFDGQQRLVNRGVYRLTDAQSGAIVFQLRGNGYTFAAGHTVKLELAPSDAPQFRASNGSFTVVVSDLKAELPLAAPPCPRTAPITLPKVRGAQRATITLAGKTLLRLSRRALLRKRRVTLRDLPVGTQRVRITVRARRPGARRTRVVKRTLTVRVCV